jgi:hypothetical protein
VWCVVCGVWCVVCGVWCVVCGVWCVVCGVWCELFNISSPEIFPSCILYPFRDADTGDVISHPQSPPVPWAIFSLDPSPNGTCLFISGGSTAAAILALPSLKLVHTFRHAPTAYSHILNAPLFPLNLPAQPFPAEVSAADG